MPHKDPEDAREYKAYWYSKNRDELKRRATARYNSLTQTKRLVNAARQRAKNKGLEFDITHEDVVIPEVCPILNKPLERFTPYAPSIDRIDPAKGYIKGNVWIISRRANLMKNDGTYEDLQEFAEWVIKRFPH